MYFIRKFNPEIHHRRSIRLRGWDYTSPGLYFITINRLVADDILFGKIISGDLVLNEFGSIVEDEWLKTPFIRPYVELDEFIVMPNHFHGIIKLLSHDPIAGATCHNNGVDVGATWHNNGVDVGATWQVAPTSKNMVPVTINPDRPRGPKPGSVGAIIAQFKMQTTKRINKITGTNGGTIWQRNFYERIIWNCDDLIRVRKYIRNNPKQV